MASNTLLALAILAGIAAAMIPPCLPQLGPEFCPSTAAAAAMSKWPAASVAYPKEMHQETVLRDLVFPRILKDRMYNETKGLTNQEKYYMTYPNRHCESRFGAKVKDWVGYDAFHSLEDAFSNSSHIVSYSSIPNGTPQQSLIIKFLPQGNWNRSNDIIVIGAHVDSINLRSVLDGVPLDEMIAPGADDNASGFVGAEEIGLVGSTAVFDSFRNESRLVKAVLNLDMVGYSGGHEPGSPVIGVHANHTNANLTSFTKNIIETYSNAKAADIACAYRCSDHASAWDNGFPSAGIGESAFQEGREMYPYIHTANDTIDHLDFDYMVEFAKVSAAFVAELAYTKFAELN
ncbi:Leucine aminopeptidase 1 [Gnomoniopsis smithogilvyi]|uniref:Peptide hydrolase n=1 Tax=Gnomoniopsis smithogilvyi TaxID=1191159 RepID=A0A9W9CX22_9PEZI|nr:Leucine aminopeptidase 1 [Gnomoniopsis smithogilvyi]